MRTLTRVAGAGAKPAVPYCDLPLFVQLRQECLYVQPGLIGTDQQRQAGMAVNGSS
jgi:hypothetical protein